MFNTRKPVQGLLVHEHPEGHGVDKLQQDSISRAPMDHVMGCHRGLQMLETEPEPTRSGIGIIHALHAEGDVPGQG